MIAILATSQNWPQKKKPIASRRGVINQGGMLLLAS
jgi:hypothetical protein